MGNFLLHNNSSAPTGPNLARLLGIPCGQQLTTEVDILVRWGTSAAIDVQPAAVLNTSEAILNAVDKRHSLRLFIESGVPSLFPTSWPGSLPAIGRRRQHQEGRGFWLCLQEADVIHALREGADYFVPYIPTKDEYRVHVLMGQVLFMQRKALKRPKGPLWLWLRNVKTGWSLDRCDMVSPIAEVGVAAVRALGLDFGAVDVLEADDRSLYVLEVNTAPRLRGEKLDIWAEALKRRIACVELRTFRSRTWSAGRLWAIFSGTWRNPKVATVMGSPFSKMEP